VLEVRGGIDADQRIVAWATQMWLPANVPGHRPFLAVDAAGLPQAHGRGAGQIAQNGDPPYAAANVQVLVHWLKETPLRLSNLRAPGKIANVFAVESFTDELAAAAGTDPVAFRLHGLTDPRAIDVLKRATEMLGWQARPSPNPQPRQDNVLTGRGVAYARYKHSENYVAMAMDVAVDPASGRIGVRRVTCAHDCGLVVNPDGLRNQIEGSIVQTLSRTLHEEVTFDRARVTSVDWVSYPILTFPEVPAIEVALLDRPTLPLFGAGEASTAPVAAALANAVFDATGVRLRAVPFTSDRVKAALAARPDSTAPTRSAPDAARQ
jgi:CO/xanthine dehydrogenase Mo-binding subunit